MQKLFKIILFLAGLAVALVVAAAIAIPLYFDPNDHKDDIARLIAERTGRDIAIQGDIGLTVFPWLGVDLGTVTLGNAEGFGPEPFAHVDNMEVRIRLMPLLKKQVEMGTVVIDGLALNLARAADGRDNWSDLAARRQPAPEQPAALPIASLAVGGLDIRGASLRWRDDRTGARYALTDLAVRTGAVVPGEPVELALSFNVQGNQPAIEGTVGVEGTLDVDPGLVLARLDGLALTADLRGDTLPGGRLTMKLGADVAADLDRDTLTVANLGLDVLGIALRGDLQANHVRSAPTFNGRIEIPPFDPRAAAGAAGVALPASADPAVFGEAALSARFSGSGDELSIEELRLTLDDTTLDGQLRIARFDRPSISFRLDADAIDLDRYLPPAADNPPASPGGGAAAAAGRLPMDALRALDLNGQAGIGLLKVSKLRLERVTVTVTAKDGLIRLQPIAARLYQGAYSGNITLDARGDTPALRLDESLSGIQAGPLLADLTGKERILGKADASATLAARGADADAVKRTLGGEVRFAFTDGAVKGVNIARLIREAKARIKGRPVPPADGPNQTDFSELTGSLQIRDGRIDNRDLVVKSPLLRITGEGNAHLVSERIDYTLNTAIVGTTKGQGGKDLQDLRNVTIPIKVSGTFQQPKYSLDLGRLLESQAKEKVKKKIEQKLGDKLKDKLPGALGDSLKGLFGR